MGKLVKLSESPDQKIGASLQTVATGKRGRLVKVEADEPVKPSFQTAPQTAAKPTWTVGNIGQYGAGNIDLYDRPRYRNADGSISTVDSASYNIDGQEVLLPTVWNQNGAPYHSRNDEEILQRYRDTGEYLGKFSTVEEANDYAEKLHLEQQERYPSSFLPAERGSKNKSGDGTISNVEPSVGNGATTNAGGFSHSGGKIDKPTAGERVGKTLHGAAKQYTAGLVNFAGLASAGQNGTMMSDTYREQMEALKREIAALEKNVNDATLTDRQRADAAAALATAKEQLATYAKAVNAGEKTAGKVYGLSDFLSESGAKDIERAKAGLGALGSLGVDVGVAGAQMGADIALGALTGGGALAPMFVRSAGGSAQEARREGATHAEQANYGLASGALSVATEKIANIAAPFKKAFGGGVLDKAIEKALARMNGSKAGKIALSFLSEGSEEVIEDLVQPILKSMYNGKSIGKNYGELEASEVLYDGLIGGILGGLGGGVEALTSRPDMSRPFEEVVREQMQGKAPEQVAGKLENTAAVDTTTQASRPEKIDGKLKNIEAPGALMRGQALRNGSGEVENRTMPVSKDVSNQQMERSADRAWELSKAKTETERTGILAGVDEDTIAKVERIANIVGREVAFFDEGADSAGGMHNGYYNPADGKIYVNARSQNPVAQIISHELTHSIEESGHYSDLQKLVLDRIRQTGGDLQAMREQKAALYARHGENLTDNAAVDSEIVAEYVEKYLLTDEQTIRAMVQQNRTLGQRILQFINELLAKMGNSSAQERVFLMQAKNYYQSALQETQSSFTADMQQRAAVQAQNMDALQRQMANGEISEEDAEAAFNDMYDPEIDMQQGLGRLQHSYAGRNANGANLESLREAQAMHEAGADMESIRKATGWHEGMDGKWRWEIDDSSMTYHRGGDAAFSRSHADYAEYQKLMRKWMTGDVTAEEETRLQQLDETWGREYGRLSERVERGNARLEDVLDHEELFRAYPQLRHVRVVFDETPKGVLGSFSAEGNQITISEELRDAPQDVLIHEIQHAIQNAEGFTKGSNRQYWEEKLTNGDEIQSKGFQEAREKLVQFQLDEANEDVLALRDRLEKVGELDDNLREYDRIWEEAERRGLDKKINEYYDLRENYYDQLHKPQRSVPSELYYNTAGEIEARDAANRRPMSGETRKRIKPDYGNGDTVFAGNGDSYSYVGKNANGIEVYETSEEVRNMPYKQRMDVFTDIMRNEYAGRTAKFTANGDVYYAKFDSKDISKNIYGDKRSSPRGWRAKINTGADGNIFELVENAAHKSSDADTGKLTSPHRGVTGWEYFVKTVQIDGRVYDLLANVRKKPDGEYVYSIQLNENKKTPASPVAVFAESNPASDVGEAGTGSIAEMGEGVKPLSLPTLGEAENGNGATQERVQPLSLPTLEPTAKVKFSLDEPVEETETLVAMHNMTEEKLRCTLDIGAWPSPSIAVVKAKEGHANYGEYSAIFPRGTIDPQVDSKNKVYGGDAWTPTHDNALVERGVNYEARRAFDNRIKDLSSQFAGGIFQGSGALGKVGLENETRLEPEQIADRLAYYPEVQAAYLQSEGKQLEPVYRSKQFDQFFSNAAIQRYLDAVGAQEVARLNVKLATGERLTAEDMKPAEQAIRETYAEEHASFLNRRPESKEKRIDYYMRNSVFQNRVEDFIRSAQEFYESGGSASEADKEATAAKMTEMIAPGGSWNDALRAVKEWVKPQLEGLLGKRGVYNGKDAVTDRGRRSFAETHWDYTAENIVKAMNMAAAKGANVYGITPETLAATATQEYKTVDEMHADEERLRTVSEEEHAKALRDLGIYLDRVVNDLMLTTMHKYDNSFEEEQNLSGIIAEAAKGKKTTAAVKEAFRKEGYAISDGHARSILALIDRAANIPTGYYEAKPQRVVGFDEALAVVAPDNAPADLLSEMRNAGMNVVEYKAGDEADRLAKVNGLEGAKFSVSETESAEEVQASEEDMRPRRSMSGW